MPEILEGTTFAWMIERIVASNRRLQQMLYDHASWMEQHHARHQELVQIRYEESIRRRIWVGLGEDSDESQHTD